MILYPDYSPAPTTPATPTTVPDTPAPIIPGTPVPDSSGTLAPTTSGMYAFGLPSCRLAVIHKPCQAYGSVTSDFSFELALDGSVSGKGYLQNFPRTPFEAL